MRLAGHGPTRFLLPLSSRLPVIHEPAPELGWRNKAGVHRWPGRGRDVGRDITMTFWPGGLRATAAERVTGRRQVVVLGGSFMQGWAVTNEDTCAWKLQAAMPQLEFLNFGTAGYGTYQSLLALEGFLEESAGKLDRVIYGFNGFHAARNVAGGAWLRAVSGTSRAGRLAVPYATLADDGSLVRHPPEQTPAWPLRHRLALSAFLEARYTDLRTRARARQRVAVTEELVHELDRVAREHGATLLIAVLSASGAQDYEAFFRRRGLAWLSCVPPDPGSPRMKVPGYGHPSREANAWWAGCIERRLREKDAPRRRRLRSRRSGPARGPGAARAR